MSDDGPRLLTCRVDGCELAADGYGTHPDAPSAAIVPLCSGHGGE